ncbi:hypothetical protein ERJ75_000572100 [Trypanosoma vivax]|nr:hypothetical protein ERJ75_000572100 [Trypanosoma vivax]
MNFSHCNTTTPVASHVEKTNFSDIVEELKRNVSELFNFSSIKNNTYILNYSKTLDKRMLPLKNGEGLSLLAEEVRKGFDLTKQKLKETHGRKQVFDVKVAFGCELEKRLNVIKDTFVALEFMLKGVLAREGILLRRATALQANATKLGVVVPGMDDTQGIRKEVSSALTEVSATLTKVLSAMYNTPTNSHSLLSYDSEFYHGIIHCRGDTQMERTVLLHLAADERRNHFGDYITWKGVISALWNEVTPALGHAHLNCSGMENISCESILNQANALIGELARSRESAEAILGDAIKVLMAVDEQIESSRSILDAAVSQRVAGHGAESADTPWTGKSLMGGFANSGFDDMFDEADDIDKNEGGDFYSGDDVGGVRSGRRAITIVLAVVVPIIVIAFACGALFVLRKRRLSSKEIADHDQ